MEIELFISRLEMNLNSHRNICRAELIFIALSPPILKLMAKYIIDRAYSRTAIKTQCK